MRSGYWRNWKRNLSLFSLLFGRFERVCDLVIVVLESKIHLQALLATFIRYIWSEHSFLSHHTIHHLRDAQFRIWDLRSQRGVSHVRRLLVLCLLLLYSRPSASTWLQYSIEKWTLKSNSSRFATREESLLDNLLVWFDLASPEPLKGSFGSCKETTE